MTRAIAAVSIALLFGCGDDPGPTPPYDGPPFAYEGDVPEPSPPALPDFSSCPAGWRSTTLPSGPAVCDPWPEGGHQECPMGQMHLPGRGGCEPVGIECTGDFPEVPASAAVAYVREGAAGGDGSRAAPFGSVTDARASGARDFVLAPGRYRVAGAGTYRGSCVADTTVDLPSDFGGVLSLSNLTVEGVTTTFDDNAEIISEGVLWSSGILYLFFPGTGLTATGSMFGSVDVVLDDAAYFTVSQSVFNDGSFIGATIPPGDPVGMPRVVMTDVHIRQGTAVNIDTGELVMERVVSDGVHVYVPEGAATLRDYVQHGGYPPDIADDVMLERVWLHDTTDALYASYGPTIIRDVVSSGASAERGSGIWVADADSLQMDRVWVEGAVGSGVVIQDVAMAMVADVTSQDVMSGLDDGTRGYALELGAGHPWAREPRATTVSLTRIRLDSSRGAALLVSASAGFPVQAHVEDLSVAEALPQACAMSSCSDSGGGVGVAVTGEATLDLTRFSISQASACGVFVGEAAGVDMRQGQVGGCVAGACVSDDGYDLGRLSDRVRYVDNDNNLSSASLPVPPSMPMPM